MKSALPAGFEPRSLAESIAEAIINNEFFLLVEGVDDIPIYEKLLCEIVNDYNVQCFSNLSDYGVGCDALISTVENLTKTEPSIAVKKIWGAIIDLDSRFFRGTIPTHPQVTTLSRYSIENFFVNKESIVAILKTTTKCGDLAETAAEHIMSAVIPTLQNLSIATAEAILHGVYEEYCGFCSFSTSVDTIKNKPDIRNSLEEWSDFILEQSRDVGFHQTVEDVLKFTKGKWLLNYFLAESIKKIRELHADCKDGSVFRCKSCNAGKYDCCQYKMQIGIDTKIGRGIVTSNFNPRTLEEVMISLSRLTGVSIGDRCN